jgi:hypothetical protein
MKKYKFRRWLRNWLYNFDNPEPEQMKLSTVRQSDEPDSDRCLNFKVWFANGGKVVQTNRYDRIKDRSQTSMYVITDNQDFGREIDKIVTMDSLRG